jgi:hypothetical protein
MSKEQFERKLRNLAKRAIGPEKAEAFIDTTSQLDTVDNVRKLTKLLS